MNDDIPELEALITKNISHALVYACHFWGRHLEDSPDEDCSTVQRHLYMLLHKNFLYWLEILSLAKAIPSAEESLLAAANFLKVRGCVVEFAPV